MSILLFILFGGITLGFWSACIASSRADKKLESLQKNDHHTSV